MGTIITLLPLIIKAIMLIIELINQNVAKKDQAEYFSGLKTACKLSAETGDFSHLQSFKNSLEQEGLKNEAKH